MAKTAIERQLSQDFKKSKNSNNHGGDTSVYHGVRRRSWGKWVSEIREPKKKSRIWLGSFDNPEMAARAHDVAAIAIKGGSAILNFPHLAHQLPKPVSKSPRDIRAAAVKAATSIIAEISPRSRDSNIRQAELEPRLGNLPTCDDIFLDLPDLFKDLGHRIDRVLFALPENMVGVESGELSPDVHSLWDFC
ncbi:hypothetical protein L1987_25862 [Smallanthus sonchifolius]|uniref:Uncharacterized protein n=1 Tax=Smallanthus sonchifolius TaxID=185202 RepID=A0ACB9I8Q3_9ASTR|nr:hypothetical protein L1987_25862 [Smallanthus sonchifolius]